MITLGLDLSDLSVDFCGLLTLGDRDLIFKTLKMLDTYPVLFLSYILINMPFAVWVMWGPRPIVRAVRVRARGRV